MTVPTDSAANRAGSSSASASSRKRRIVPHLWFDSQAEEATEFYASLFEDATLGDVTRYSREGQEVHGQEPGSVMTVELDLAGTHVVALNGGPHFRFTPAISFFVTCDSAEEVDRLWERLSTGGSELMALGSYDWSERYAWVQDRFGLSWQLFFGDVQRVGQRVVPCLLFTGDEPKAQASIDLYTSVFPDSGIDNVYSHPSDGPMAGMVAHSQFTLNQEVFMAMDGGPQHDFGFTEAISLLVQCEDQAEIDHYWSALGDGSDPRAQQCGWLKDRFGVSWQVTPRILGRMIKDPDRNRVERVTKAFMAMKKLDIGQLEEAYRG